MASLRVTAFSARSCMVHVFVKPDPPQTGVADKVRVERLTQRELDTMVFNSKGRSEDEVRVQCPSVSMTPNPTVMPACPHLLRWRCSYRSTTGTPDSASLS